MDLKKLGGKIKKIRKEKKLTFKDIAEKSGLSKGLLSKIERGLSAPSLSSLRKISLALETPLVSFFESDGFSNKMVVRKNERKILHIPNINMTYQLLTPDIAGKKIEFLVTEMEGQTIDEIPHNHPGEEYGVVIEGKLKVYLNGEIIIMDRGDSINFSGSISHYISNPFEEKSVSIWSIVPPLY